MNRPHVTILKVKLGAENDLVIQDAISRVLQLLAELNVAFEAERIRIK